MLLPFILPCRASTKSIAMGLPIPLILGLLLTEPVATITASYLPFCMVSEVASSCFTLTPSLFISCRKKESRRALSTLNAGTASSIRLPPNASLFSYRVTLCPLVAATHAACSPPGPAPMTATFLGLAVLSRVPSYLVWNSGFTEQVNTPLFITAAPPQLIFCLTQGRISSTLPSRALLGHSGSAHKGLPIATKSALPVASISSANSGTVIPPLQITGTFILPDFLISSARKTLVPRG